MRRILAIGAFTLLGACTSQAADLIVDDAAAPVDTSLVNSSIYVQLLGGVALPGEVTYYYDGDPGDVHDTLAGYALAGTLGVVVVDGFSVEADVLHTSRSEDGGDGYTYSTTSLMGNLKYTAGINDTFGVYGAVGLGYVWATSESPDSKGSYDYTGAGYQLIAGVSAKFADNMSGLLEYRYQNTFEPGVDTDDDYYGFSAPVSTVLAGVKIGF